MNVTFEGFTGNSAVLSQIQQEAAGISGTDCVAWIKADLVDKGRPRVEWRSNQTERGQQCRLFIPVIVLCFPATGWLKAKGLKGPKMAISSPLAHEYELVGG